MNKSTKVIIGVIVAAFVGLIGISLWQKNQPTPQQSADFALQTVKDTFAKINYDDYNLNSVIAAQEVNGNIAENIEGPADAPVKIYEYADYQCSYCAMMAPLLSKLVEDYNGKVAVVFRTYVLDYHPNGVIAASAANAAALQGYWEEYHNLLFANQNAWYDSTGDGLMAQLEQYLTIVSDGKADLEKFRSDIKSQAVAQKVAFDMGAGEKMDIGGTPWLYLDGEWIKNEKLSPTEYIAKIREQIDAKLKDDKSKK